MDLEELKMHVHRFTSVLPHPQASLVPLIAMIVKSEGHVSEEVHAALVQACDVSSEQVRELELECQRSAEPECAFRVCGDLICILNRGQEVFESLRASGVGVVVTGCPGYCHAAPVVQQADGKFFKARLKTVMEPGNLSAVPVLLTDENQGGSL